MMSCSTGYFADYTVQLKSERYKERSWPEYEFQTVQPRLNATTNYKPEKESIMNPLKCKACGTLVKIVPASFVIDEWASYGISRNFCVHCCMTCMDVKVPDLAPMASVMAAYELWQRDGVLLLNERQKLAASLTWKDKVRALVNRSEETRRNAVKVDREFEDHE